MKAEIGQTGTTLPLSAIVLAGGRSSRMGRDKALISIQGIPLLRRVCDLALQCVADVYIVSPWVERYRDVLPSSCILVRETSLPVKRSGQTTDNPHLPHGPLIGFAQGLAQVQTDWILLLACDLPRLRLEVLQDWIAMLAEAEAAADQNRSTASGAINRPEAIAFLSRQARGWDPLCGFYRRSCLPDLTDFINQGGRSFQQWLTRHSVQELPLADTQMLFNCNRPEDLDTLSKI